MLRTVLRYTLAVLVSAAVLAATAAAAQGASRSTGGSDFKVIAQLALCQFVPFPGGGGGTCGPLPGPGPFAGSDQIGPFESVSGFCGSGTTDLVATRIQYTGVEFQPTNAPTTIFTATATLACGDGSGSIVTALHGVGLLSDLGDIEGEYRIVGGTGAYAAAKGQGKFAYGIGPGGAEIVYDGKISS